MGCMVLQRGHFSILLVHMGEAQSKKGGARRGYAAAPVRDEAAVEDSRRSAQAAAAEQRLAKTKRPKRDAKTARWEAERRKAAAAGKPSAAAAAHAARAGPGRRVGGAPSSAGGGGNAAGAAALEARLAKKKPAARARGEARFRDVPPEDGGGAAGAAARPAAAAAATVAGAGGAGPRDNDEMMLQIEMDNALYLMKSTRTGSVQALHDSYSFIRAVLHKLATCEPGSRQKYGKIRLASEKVRSRVSSAEGALDFMQAAGFDVVEMPTGDFEIEPFLIFQGGDDMQRLNLGIQAIDRRLHEAA